MNKLLTIMSALIFVGASSSAFADAVQNNVIPNGTNVEVERGGGGGGHGGGGGFHGGGGGYHGGGGGNHGGGGYHGGGGNHGGGGYHGGGHFGHIGHPVRFGIGHAPYGGWRGNVYFWGGVNYYVWAWGPWAPWWGWGPYVGWRLGLDYYVPEGLKCIADNSQVAGEWSGPVEYNASDDAINAALDVCKNDPYVVNANAQAACRIRTCVEWDGRRGD